MTGSKWWLSIHKSEEASTLRLEAISVSLKRSSEHVASKRRADSALSNSRQKSFGIREEHRVSLLLFHEIRSQLRSQDPEAYAVTLTDCPSYVWAVKSEVYLDFLRRSADKFAAGFEVNLATQ
jgi:hypothetical protein